MRHAWILAPLAVSAAALPATAAESLDSTPRTAVMSAFAPEWESLRAAVAEPRDHVVNGTTFVTGRLEGREVVLLLTGVSMVNAAMATQLVLDRFNVERIVFSGIAGGVDPELNIGDVVVAAHWGQYLEAVFARATPEGGWHVPAFLGSPPFPPYGMIHPWTVEVARVPGEEPESRFWFPVEPELLQAAERIAPTVELARCVPAAPDDCLDEAPRIVVGGNGVSGQAFVDNADFRSYAHRTFGARVLDMESAAVAHVAYVNRVPFIAFRSLSDLAGGGEGENQMATFLQLAAENAAAVVRAFVKDAP